jgi:phosphoribosyl 1,2-cyclic phosphate phosphodiesterase
MRVTVLGSGTSHGVPMIGCDCAVCTSDDPRDKRTRTSIHVETAGQSILVDTSPELRVQCLARGIRRVDAVLFTHHHADHVTGLDDLRRFNYLMGKPLDCYASAATLDVLRMMFSYAFVEMPEYVSTKPELNLVEITAPVQIGEARVTPIPLMHGQMPVLGFRFGDFAYCTDCSFIPETSFALLDGLKALILDGLRHRPHATHFNLAQAIEAAQRIGAQETYFTHIAHELGHQATNAALPEGMALAYDGQVIEI